MSLKDKIYLLYILLIPVLLGGFALSLASLEPYPAMVFPGFEQAGSADHSLYFEKPVFDFYSGGQVYELEAAEVLDQLPESYISAVLQNRYRYCQGQYGPRKAIAAEIGGRNYQVVVGPRSLSNRAKEEWKDHLAGIFADRHRGLQADSLLLQWYSFSGTAGDWKKESLDCGLTLHFQPDTKSSSTP